MLRHLVYIKAQFWALVLSSLVMPAGIYAFMIAKKRISRSMVLGFGILLLMLSAIDALLLTQMNAVARSTTSLIDDVIFASEFSIALYLLPLVSAAIGTDLISHVLIAHLATAERTCDGERIDAAEPGGAMDPQGRGPASGP